MKVMLAIYLAYFIFFSPIESNSNKGLKKVLSIVKDIKENMINVDDVVKALTPIIEDNCACCDIPKCKYNLKQFFYLTFQGHFLFSNLDCIDIKIRTSQKCLSFAFD